MKLITALSILLAVIVLSLMAAPALARSFQPVLRLTCPAGELVVDARPYDGNTAGSSQVERRYHYRGAQLASINYEAYYHNLNAYLHQKVIHGRTLLGVMPTRTTVGISGIARIVFADAPIKDIYGGFLRMIVVERDGRVVLLTNLVTRAPADSAVWGHVVPSKGGKPILRAKRRIMLAGKERAGTDFLVEKNARGSRLQDDFTVALE